MKNPETQWPADKVERRLVADLIPFARNSRTHSDAQIAQIAGSIREWGWTVPVLVDPDGGIIAGHARVMAAQKLDIKEVPCMVADGWSAAQKAAYVIADNKLALNAGWDTEMLKIEMTELASLEFNLELIGFDALEIQDLLFVDPAGGLTDPNAVPDPPAELTTFIGDVWALGDHRLICGDSTDVKVIEKLMDGQLADMWLTDPPYNVDYEGKTKDALKIKNDEMTDAEFRLFLSNSYLAADAVMKAGAVFYIWHADSEGYNFRGAAADIGWQIRQCLIWKKQHMVMGRQDYHWQHEPCLYGWKAGAAHLWATDRKQTTILEFDRPSASKVHPTMKPVALFEYLVLNNTKGQDIVLDSFAGSGTTLIVCQKNGRHARVSELDPVYAETSIKRWMDYTGKQATLLETGQTYDEVRIERLAAENG